MSINLKNREAVALIHELKRRTGKGATDILLDLLRREKERLEADFEAKVAQAMEANRVMRERWKASRGPDAPEIDDVLAYDEHGFPV